MESSYNSEIAELDEHLRRIENAAFIVSSDVKREELLEQAEKLRNLIIVKKNTAK